MPVSLELWFYINITDFLTYFCAINNPIHRSPRFVGCHFPRLLYRRCFFQAFFCLMDGLQTQLALRQWTMVDGWRARGVHSQPPVFSVLAGLVFGCHSIECHRPSVSEDTYVHTYRYVHIYIFTSPTVCFYSS
jgi:hypothetical protein